MRARRGAAGAVLAAVTAACLPAPAAATFHEISIREVYPGSAAAPESEYVELQMWAPGQNLVGGHSLAIYDDAGALVGAPAFAADVGSGANQSTVLVATPAATSEFAVTADAGMAPNLLDPGGGAVCWESIDCVAWGSFSRPLPSPAGAPASPTGIPAGMALRRTIAPGCASLLEPTDDRDNSAADFASVFPAPRSNASAPTERTCQVAGGQSGGPGGEGPRRAPRTTLKRRPARRAADRTPTFGFVSNQPQATFQCRLDGGRFRPCRSPFTTRRLGTGRHVFAVRARGPLVGVLDPSPATYAFRVLP